MTPGIYHLLIHLSQDASITVGKLGDFHFPAGYYIYTGSALGGLESRVSRHLSSKKRLHWHIDYLLQHGQVIDVVTHETTERLECQSHQKILSLPNCKTLVKGFGSSDCKCRSHLAYFKEKPENS
jgi:Uri superfamily endonuclease